MASLNPGAGADLDGGAVKMFNLWWYAILWSVVGKKDEPS